MRGIKPRILAAVAAALTAASAPESLVSQALAKGVPPVNAACDGAAKSDPGWTACLGLRGAALDDAELFYAGYWLARSGRYEEALRYLEAAKTPDERIFTYRGFATRKLGHTAAALPFYEKALALNPDYTVARSYLGEAFLALGEPQKAYEQLEEIRKRCGTACAEYADLAAAISSRK